MRGLAYVSSAQRQRVRQRHARRRQVRSRAQVPQAGGRARRGLALRRPLLREERVARHPARRLQAELSRWRAMACSRPCRWCRHEWTDVSRAFIPARVENNIDPNNMARIQVSIADVGGRSISSWAKPCLPVTGTNTGMYTVPPIGAAVWVQFVRGNADEPVWLGGYFAEGEAPQLHAASRRASTASRCRLPEQRPRDQRRAGWRHPHPDRGRREDRNQRPWHHHRRAGREIKLSGGTVNINNNALTVT